MQRFEAIRSYRDDEIPAAMQRIANDAAIHNILDYFDLGCDTEQFREVLCHIETIDGFQRQIVRPMVEAIIRRTTNGLSVTGMDCLDPEGHYLLVSNHRDIVLDAMLLAYAFLQHGLPLFNIAFGSNLVFNSLANDFAKSNRMFEMDRGGTKMEFYNKLALSSEYIRHLAVQQHESVWIAQRNGRTKDGIDATDPALVKMLGMSRRDDRVAALAELDIVPVAVSYEWESCDKLKTIELYLTKKNGHYEKQPNEDLNSVITGIRQPKGRVRIHVGERLSEADLVALNDCNSGEFYRRVAQVMDDRINRGYALFPNNYIAHDLRSGTTRFADRYTPEQKAEFEDYLRWLDKYKELEINMLNSIFLGIYANPVDSFLKVLESRHG